MKSFKNFYIVIPLLAFQMTADIYAQESKSNMANTKRVFFSFGVKSRAGSWGIEKNDYLLTNTANFDKGAYSPIDKVNSDYGFSVGPEVELMVHWFFLRGHYLRGSYRFDAGDAKRADMGVDAGLQLVSRRFRLGLFVGWRSLKVDFSDWTNVNIEGIDVSDGVIGLLMASAPGKPGFVLSLEAAFGFGLLSQWEKPNVAEGELVMGFRLKAIPLTFLVGYGARADYVPTGQVVEVYNEFYDQIIRTIEGQHNVVHGPVLRISYGF